MWAFIVCNVEMESMDNTLQLGKNGNDNNA